MKTIMGQLYDTIKRGKKLDSERKAREARPINEMSANLKNKRQADMAEGKDFASDYFGAGNPAMAEILAARKDAAFGTDTGATDLARARGVQGINSQFATGMRSLRGLQGMSGISGGAALGQALPHLAKANLARGELESNLAVDALGRRDAALSNYESSITGERAGELGSIFGMAGLGAGDRASAMQYVLGKGFLDQAAQGMGRYAAPNPQQFAEMAYPHVAGHAGMAGSVRGPNFDWRRDINPRQPGNVIKTWYEGARGGLKF